MNGWSRTITLLTLAAFTSLAWSREPRVGDPSKGFVLKDFQGKTVSLDDFRGKVVLLDFWANWCAPCKVELPLLDGLQKRFGKADFVILAVNIDHKISNSREFLKKNAIEHLTLLWDEKQVAVGLYDVEKMPTSFLLDRNGEIRSIHSGFQKEDIPGYAKEIQALIEEDAGRKIHAKK